MKSRIGGFGIEEIRVDGRLVGARIICRRCGVEVGRYSGDEIMRHAFTGHQYACPKCDEPAAARR